MSNNIDKNLKKIYKDKKPLDDLQHVMMYFTGGIVAILLILMFTLPKEEINLWLVLVFVVPIGMAALQGFIPMMKQASPVFDAFSAGYKDSLDQVNPAFSFDLTTNQGTRRWNIYLGGGYNAYAFSIKGKQVILVPKDDVIEHGSSVITFNTGKYVSLSELPYSMQREIVSRIPTFNPVSKIWYLTLSPRVDLVHKFNSLYGQEEAEFSVSDMQHRELMANRNASITTAYIENERTTTRDYTKRKYKKDIQDMYEPKEEKFDE